MEHLALAWRKVLNARIGVLKATARRWADARVRNIASEFGQLESHLLLRAAQLQNTSPDNEILPVALARISTALNVQSVTGIQDSLLDQVLLDVSAELEGVVCLHCGASPACVADPRIVELHGSCIRSFREGMELAQAEARAWYEKFLPGCLQTAPLIEFSTLLVCNPPDSIPVAKYVSGKTSFADTTELRSEVQLLVHVADVDLESYHAAAYILFHELICHAYQGIRGATRNRDRRTRETDSFAEGWMDWIAFRIFTDVTSGDGWSDVQPTLDREAREIVNRFRDARQGRLGNSSRERTRAFFQIGEEAAQQYHAFLNSQNGWSAADADEALFRISFDWNVRGDCRQRQEFVTSVRQILLFERSSEKIAGLTRSLDKYRNSGNVLDLVEFD